MLLFFCSGFCPHPCVAVQKNNLRRLLRTVEALSDLGPEMTAEREFPQTARAMVSALMQAGGAREGVLFTFSDKPSMLSSVASEGFALDARARHHAAAAQACSCPDFGARTGRPERRLLRHLPQFERKRRAGVVQVHCAAESRRKLVGLVALGRREGDALFDDEELDALDLLCNYVAIAMQNHVLSQTLAQRVSENLRLLASLHGFYDTALEAFATAIDVKHVNIHGHSLRVGRYASAIGEAMGMDPNEVAALRSAGYLHDIGKVAVDKRLFGKPSSLDAEEFREMADHTVVGHQIVSGVQFPWPRIPEIVRSHHERGDGSGYPDGLVMDDVAMPVAHHRPGRHVRRHDQRAALSRAALGRQHAQRDRAAFSAEI